METERLKFWRGVMLAAGLTLPFWAILFYHLMYLIT